MHQTTQKLGVSLRFKDKHAVEYRICTQSKAPFTKKPLLNGHLVLPKHLEGKVNMPPNEMSPKKMPHEEKPTKEISEENVL